MDRWNKANLDKKKERKKERKIDRYRYIYLYIYLDTNMCIYVMIPAAIKSTSYMCMYHICVYIIYVYI